MRYLPGVSLPSADGVIIQFDLGNTRCKWRVARCLGGGHFSAVSSGAFAWQSLSDVSAHFQSVFEYAAVSVADVVAVWVVSVAGAQRNKLLSEWCKMQGLPEPCFAVSQLAAGGVVNGYQSPELLGVDRWLAILAGWHIVSSPCLVIDAGSAVTVDLLADRGQHLGGYIGPGLALMRQSLFGGTDNVKVQPAALSAVLAPGRKTSRAVSSALNAMLLGLVQTAKAQLESQLSNSEQDKLPLLLTGGDAGGLKHVIDEAAAQGVLAGVDVMLVPDLVFTGLQIQASAGA